MGYDFVKDIRQGKVFEIEIEALSEEEIKQIIPELADKVLANPIIEKFTWEIID
jgi:phosphoribosylformylglycinamidine synthase